MNGGNLALSVIEWMVMQRQMAEECKGEVGALNSGSEMLAV